MITEEAKGIEVQNRIYKSFIYFWFKDNNMNLSISS